MDADPQFWIRVLLFDHTDSLRLKIDSSFSIINPQTPLTPAHFDRADVPIDVSISAGRIAVGGWSFISHEVIIAPDAPYIFSLNGDDFRGKLKLILHPDGNNLDAVNLVPLEPYLAGVIGAEMPGYWEPAALAAQAIAARTYCLYIKKQFGAGAQWDIRKTQANQTYQGVKVESAQVWDAVDKTQGRVLVCKQANGTEGIFPAYYSSTCGGHTENSQYVFGGDFFEPLAGVRCPYCKGAAKPGFFSWPVVQFDKSTVETRLFKRYPTLTQLGQIKEMIPIRQSDYEEFSRLTLIKVVGSTGKSDVLRAEDLRLAIDPTGLKLKSAVFKIVAMDNNWGFLSGRGFGHGVGMCQYGAQEMARRGKTAAQILLYYYPGSKIVSIYQNE
jgi:stage II sporulation protein D